jgi:pilus assembly protein Flp/PilA
LVLLDYAVTAASRSLSRAVDECSNEACAMTRFCSQFLKDEAGATAIEYGLIASGIVLAILGSIQQLSGTVKSILWDAVVGALS